MLRGYWCIGIAAVLAFAHPCLGQPQQQQEQSETSEAPTNKADQPKPPSLVNAAGIPDPVERAIKNPSPYTGEDHEQRDLAAQEAMAVWAFWMVLFAGLTVLITFFGTILIWRQVKLTREAVDDTGQATAEMRKANEIAKVAQRPWIKIDGQLNNFVFASDSAFKLEFRVNFQNIGKNVAESFYIDCKFLTCSDDFLDEMDKAFAEFISEEIERDMVLIPEDSTHWSGQVIHSLAALPWRGTEKTRGSCHLVVAAMCRYKLPDEDGWRFSMQCFSIGENRGHVDDTRIYNNIPRDITAEQMVMRRFGRSRAN